jgi:hypothetical protein
MPRVLMSVLAVLVAAATATAVILFRQNRALRDELAQLRASNELEAEAAPSSTPAQVVAPVPEVASPPPAAPAESVPAREATAARPNPRRDSADRRGRGQEYFALALADPEYRAAMLTRAKGQVDRMLGDYLVKLNLDEMQIETLRTLLAERQLARMESGMLERSAETEQERLDAQAWRDTKLAATESDINAILGPDGLKNLQSYLDSAPQRRVIDDIARRASYAGAPLTNEASDRLLAAVQQASADVPLPDIPGWGRGMRGDDQGGQRESLTPDVAANYLRELRARNQRIIEQAREFLTQSQLEALADQQIDEMQQTEAQLNFLVRNPDARGLGGGRGPGG